MYKDLSVLALLAVLLVGCGKTSTPVQNQTLHLSHDKAVMLTRSNQIRAELYSGHPLRWSNSLANIAQAHANYLARTNTLAHSTNRPGENLFASSSITGGYADAIEKWYSEKKDYDFGNKKCKPSKVCGHYTQTIWKKTREIGCGKSRSASWGTIVICNYSERGNIRGDKAF